MIVTKDLTGWLDDDEGFLAGLDLAWKINYFEKRVRMALIRPLDRLVDTEDLFATPDTNAVLIAGVSICHGIEAIGRFYQNGRRREDGEECFKAFARDFMHEDLRLKWFQKKPYPELLWDNFRCALSHGFSIRGGGFEGSKSDSLPYFATDGGRFKVHPYKLYADFRQAFDGYLKELRRSNPSPGLIGNFEAAYDWFFVKRN